MACRKPVGDVHQQQPGARQLRQAGDVLQNGFVRFRVLNSDENVVIHVQLSL